MMWQNRLFIKAVPTENTLPKFIPLAIDDVSGRVIYCTARE